MSARRARFEAWRARVRRLPLPDGHPYAVLPRWVPYPLARLFGRIQVLVPAKRRPPRAVPERHVAQPRAAEPVVADIDRDFSDAAGRVGRREWSGGGVPEVQEVVRAVLAEVARGAPPVATAGSIGAWPVRPLPPVRVGDIDIRPPQDGEGRLSIDLLARLTRSEQALVTAMAAGYLAGFATPRTRTAIEALCGHAFSAEAIVATAGRLDGSLRAFAERRLAEPFAYLAVDRLTLRVRDSGVVRELGIAFAAGIDATGRRQVLAVEALAQESTTAWREFLAELRERGLRGVEYVVAGDSPALDEALAAVLPEAVRQLCCTRFLREIHALVPGIGNDDCLQELRWIQERSDRQEARADAARWAAKWRPKHPRLCQRVAETIEATFPVYRLPASHRRTMRSLDMLEPFLLEVGRRLDAAGILTEAQDGLRIVRSVAVETHEAWLDEPAVLGAADRVGLLDVGIALAG